MKEYVSIPNHLSNTEETEKYFSTIYAKFESVLGQDWNIQTLSKFTQKHFTTKFN